MPTSESSANGHLLAPLRLGLAPLADPAGQLVKLPLEPPELERDDQHVDEHDEKDDPIRSGNVLLRRGHGEHHASSSRSSRRRESSRFPASSTWKSVAASVSIAASETQKVRNIEPDICGPCSVKTTGWISWFANRIARKLIGIRTTPKRAYTAHMFARAGPGSTE